MPFSLYNIHFESYIKPQLSDAAEDVGSVVYLLIPTSNHNHWTKSQIANALYIFWFLHQTTTTLLLARMRMGCISFDSYIKPQRTWSRAACRKVVYLLIPTSNHNKAISLSVLDNVVYLLIPTSNHNLLPRAPGSPLLYIFWFLHQTTTSFLRVIVSAGCISFDSYIKPQPLWLLL